MTVEELKIIVSANNSDFQQKMNRSKAELVDFGETSKKATEKALSGFKALAAGIAALGIGKLIRDSITDAMDTVESESLFETSFGGYSKAAREWSEQLEKDLGLNSAELRKNAGMLFTMTRSMGVAGDQSYKLSTDLTKLSGDMASFYNISSEEAFTKLKSGLTGEAEPLKALGILVDETTVKQYAYATGIAKTGEELTQQQKVLARYQAIMAQTSTAQGDLARTIDSPANQLRLLQNEFDKAKREAGTAFLPLVQTVLPMLTAGLKAVAPHFTAFAEKISAAGQYIAGLNPIAQGFLKLMLLSAVAIPAVTIATQGLVLAKTSLHAIQALLIPQTVTLGTVMKAAFGWTALAAGAIALLISLNGGSAFSGLETSADSAGDSLDSLNGDFDSTSLTAANASDSLSDLSDQMDSLEEATSNLAGFDELNIMDSSGTVMGRIISSEDVENLNDFSSLMDELSQDLSGLQSSAGKGIKLNIFTDGFVRKLENAEGVVEKIFGSGWTDFWESVGMAMFEGIENGDWYPLLSIANQNVESLFGSGWTSFWEDVGEGMYEGINNGDWYPAISTMNSGVKSLLGSKWTDFWEDLGEKMYTGINEGDWYPLVSTMNSSVKNLFGEGWTNFWDDLGQKMYIGIHEGDWYPFISTLNAKVRILFGSRWTDHWEDVGEGMYEGINNGDWYPLLETMNNKTRALFGKGWTDFWEGVGQKMHDAMNPEDISLTGTGFLNSAARTAGYSGTSAVRMYASGGFPDYGELFIANEAGPELVGRIGKRTAVANNDQITEAIASAVYNAFVSARSGDNGNIDITVPVYIGGDKVDEQQYRYNKRQQMRSNGRR